MIINHPNPISTDFRITGHAYNTNLLYHQGHNRSSILSLLLHLDTLTDMTLSVDNNR